ncbi:MAG: ATP-binding protein [Planctomycetota bacterium]|nr:ATP-binding protein [Planctomycetota bacterium]
MKPDVDGLIHLSRTLKDELAEYKKVGLREFVRSDRHGAVHTLEGPHHKQSVVNTAELIRATVELPQFCSGIDEESVVRWKQEIILPKIPEYTDSLNLDRPEDSEFAAYRLSIVLGIVGDRRAKRKLLKWINNYTNRWLLGRARFDVSIFLLHLLHRVLGTARAFPASQVQRVVATLLGRQVASRAGDTEAEINYVDIALMISLAEPFSIDSDMLSYGILALREGAKDGRIWKNRQPLLRMNRRTVGCSTFQACLAVLGSKHLSERVGDLFPALASHHRWLREHRVDLDTPWRVADLHLRKPVRETWFNCLTLKFTRQFHSLIRGTIRSHFLRVYRGAVVSPSVLWEDVVLGKRERRAIEKAFLPRRSSEAQRYVPRLCTALLFGPPGTAKTTLVKAVAERVGWPLIELGMFDFVSSGIDGIFENAVRILDDLTHLRKVVILLDEVEEVFAAREKKQTEVFQKFLTAALLPPLQKLHDKGEVILFIATNHITRFDDAVRRAGRIDLVIPVGWPDEDQRVALIRRILSLNETTSRQLAKGLPFGTLIAEIVGLGKFISRQRASKDGRIVEVILKRWKKEFSALHEGDEKALAKFKREKRKYGRFS